MKSLEHLPRYRQFWVTRLTVALLLFGQFLMAEAQTSQNTITTTGEDSKFEQTLIQPVEFLESLRIAPEELQRQLGERPRILVNGAGFVHNTGFEQVLVAPTELLESMGIDLEKAQSELRARPRILVNGAGFAHDVDLASFTDTQQVKSSIHVVGASFARHAGLVTLTETQNPQQSKSGITIAGAGSTRNIDLVSPPSQ